MADHNTEADAHNDIRLLIQDLTNRLNALADSDDTTLDQMSELVAYIKSNRDLISAITTSKVSVTDIVDDLVTNVANKPLSAAKGVALKALIDAITVPDKLPNPNALTFSGAVTGSYDGSTPLTLKIPSGGGGGESVIWESVADVTLEEDVQSIDITLSKSCKKVWIAVTLYGSTQNTKKSSPYFYVGGSDFSNMVGITNRVHIDFSSASMIWNFPMLFAEAEGGIIHENLSYETSEQIIDGWETPSNYLGSDMRESFRTFLPEKIETVRLTMWGTYFGVGTRVVVMGA
ncbi:hypothetical protein [Dysosmobacter sp.]|uniref:hypothetical protein n=1 Tax=Dysosmobacter sp. TaxID=2591382 RepID=UPI002A98A261|nr:hypothetical protein [Dysosmobacter sp.]MDY5612685.1 hypothetical protein [Dysosmobacter sp.]